MRVLDVSKLLEMVNRSALRDKTTGDDDAIRKLTDTAR